MSNAGKLVFGVYPGAMKTITSSFAGTLDEAVALSTALTDAQVSSLYEAGTT